MLQRPAVKDETELRSFGLTGVMPEILDKSAEKLLKYCFINIGELETEIIKECYGGFSNLDSDIGRNAQNNLGELNYDSSKTSNKTGLIKIILNFLTSPPKNLNPQNLGSLFIV